MFVAHLDHGGKLMHQHIPFPLDVLGARYEYLLMKALVDPTRCFGCGHCFCHCPTSAARVVRKEGYELTYCASDLVSVINR